MSRFTSKDLMVAMGLKIRDKFTVRGCSDIYTVYEAADCEIKVMEVDGLRTQFPLSVFMYKELIVLPRYTMTSDEKSIIKNIVIVNEERASVKRTSATAKGILCYDGELVYVLPYAHLFPFLEEDVEVKLIELRKFL